ncbi:unnamed protein product [Effrenium voratum]|nr:unnamed protein product [Effrenium voratum]
MTVAADVPCTKVASLVSNEDRAECFGREPIFSLSEGSPVCGIRNEVDHLSLRTDSLHSIDNDSEEAPVPDPQDALEVLEVLGPPLACLPKDIEIQELNAYRADYQNFRAGHASGARGEMASLCASVREQRLMDTCSGEASAGTYYKTFAKRRPRLVPLIGLDLATSSAVRSAATAASEHLAEMAQIHSAISGRAETSEDSGQELVEVTKKERSRKSSQADAKPTPCFANGTFGASRASKSRSRGPQLRQCSAPGPDQAFSLRQSWTTLIQKGAVPTTVAENDLEDPGAFQRSPRSNTSLGIGFLTHIAVSMVCLMPFLHTQATPHSCLLLPTLYMGYVVGLWLRFGPCAKSERVPVVMTKVLRMERLVSEGSLPVWFPHLAAAAYVVMVGMLELGHRFQTVSKSQRMLSAGPVRHDYNCWGTGQEDVADCILVRHAGCTMTVSFYTCLIVMKVCNRKVKGSDLVGEHERSLQQLFPLEAPSLLSYVERSVKSNSTFWRSHRHYKAQSLILSLAWTLMSFYVYTELLQGAKTKSAQAVFCTALVFTFMLQYTLLRHVLLRVIVILEGVKARAAAMAFCDEEGLDEDAPITWLRHKEE